MELSNRIKNIAPSGSIEIAAQISKLRVEGHKIIGLNVGEPDFKTNESIVKATSIALQQGKTRYSLVSGEAELRTGIANYISKKFSHKITKENVLVGNGSKQIIYNTFQAILNEGDEVIVPKPYWVTIPESVKLAGGVNIFVESKEDFHLDFEAIEKAITIKTKAIYINTPNNPTGVVYTDDEILRLGNIAKENDLFIVSDEAYEALVYDRKFKTVPSLSRDLEERTICIQSFSKTFCMTGFRIGYMIAPKEIIKSIDIFQGHLCGNVAPFTQFGAVEALKKEQKILPHLIETMSKRRDLSYELFSKLFKCQRPSGAFYLFLDIRQYIAAGTVKDSKEMVEKLIKDARVAMVPGSSFGQEGFIRLAYTAKEEDIKEAFERTREALI